MAPDQRNKANRKKAKGAGRISHFFLLPESSPARPFRGRQQNRGWAPDPRFGESRKHPLRATLIISPFWTDSTPFFDQRRHASQDQDPRSGVKNRSGRIPPAC